MIDILTIWAHFVDLPIYGEITTASRGDNPPPAGVRLKCPHLLEFPSNINRGCLICQRYGLLTYKK